MNELEEVFDRLINTVSQEEANKYDKLEDSIVLKILDNMKCCQNCKKDKLPYEPVCGLYLKQCVDYSEWKYDNLAKEER